MELVRGRKFTALATTAIKNNETFIIHLFAASNSFQKKGHGGIPNEKHDNKEMLIWID